MIDALHAAEPRKSKKQPEPNSELRQRQPKSPTLRLTPYAWAKLLFLRDAGPTEIGGFGVAALGDPLLIEDVRLIGQRCDWASVEFDDASVADFFDEEVDQGRTPEEFARIWVHTHPGTCPQPSATDEETFQRVFGSCDWAVMFILARGGAAYARLRFGVGPGGNLEIPVEVAFDAPFRASAREAWQEEYTVCVLPRPSNSPVMRDIAGDAELFDPWSSVDEYGWAEFFGEEAAYDQP